MRCLLAASSLFVQRASLTVYIDLSDVTNRYYTVQYRTVVVYEKKNRSLVFSGSRKNPNPRVHRSVVTRQASFPTPTGTVGPRVGIIVSPLNINDGFYLSYPCYLTHRAVVVFWKVVRPLNAVDVHRVPKARVGGEHERGYDPLSLRGLGGSPP